jgi:hypothetical protein
MSSVEWVLVATAEDGSPQDVLVAESQCDATQLASDIRRAGTNVSIEARDTTELAGHNRRDDEWNS